MKIKDIKFPKLKQGKACFDQSYIYENNSYENEIICFNKFKKTSRKFDNVYPYQIKITEENKDKLPVVPEKTMQEADEMFGDIVDHFLSKGSNCVKLPDDPEPVIVHETFSGIKVKK